MYMITTSLFDKTLQMNVLYIKCMAHTLYMNKFIRPNMFMYTCTHTYMCIICTHNIIHYIHVSVC